MKKLAFLFLFVWLSLHASSMLAQISKQSLQKQTEEEIKDKLLLLLSKYCKDSCQIIDIKAHIEEIISESADPGFENLQEEKQSIQYKVKDVFVNVQVDQRISAQNREKLDRIVARHLESFAVKVSVHWVPIDIPRIGSSETTLENLKDQLIGKISKQLYEIISVYCPESCILSNVIVFGHLINPEQALNLNDQEYISDHTAQAFMAIDKIAIELTLDKLLTEDSKTQILEIMKAKTRAFKHVEFIIENTVFPETFSEKQKKILKNSDDPYGLERLKQTLTLFRDLAGTKEIISKSSETSDVKTKDSSSSTSSENKEFYIYLFIGILLIIIITMFALKFSGAKRDAQALSMPQKSSHLEDIDSLEGFANGSIKQGSLSSKNQLSTVKLIIEKDALKRELSELFLQNPKVAKETFSRMLQEESLDLSSKYVHLFGKVVVFELLNDPSLQRRLYELSEFYQKSEFNFSTEEQIKLLSDLKTKVTASEIRILSQSSTDQFDFLSRFDASQVFQLIKDETSQVQSIVLTQLPRKIRRSVFDLFTGQSKVQLLKQLSSSEAIPKEYLTNVAKALSKKIMNRPEFDTQNLRSSDILLDLMEKSSLNEQKDLLLDLQSSNSDAARAIKMKLVSIQMLAYLKDGHLLEIFLGLSQEDMTVFLAGCPEHIQRLIMSRAPSELAQSWSEELENMVGIDDDKYRIVEMNILQKIRSLASNGAISIFDINEMIFSKNQIKSSQEETDLSGLPIPKEQIVA